MTEVYGFDSRYWNGYLTEETDFKFAGIKISENTDFVPEEPIKQWKRAKRVYGLLRLPFHFWRAPKWWQDPHKQGKEQAQFFYDTLMNDFGGKYNGMGELPPALDLEDTYAPKNRRSVQSIKACLNKIEQLFGKEPIVYTAGWWFDSYIKPIYSPENFGGWDIYSYDVWEADPPPDTPVGEWEVGNIVIVQYALDVSHPAFNAKIDKNQTTQAWIDSVIEQPEETYSQEEWDEMVQEYEDKISNLELEKRNLTSKLNSCETEKNNIQNSINDILEHPELYFEITRSN